MSLCEKVDAHKDVELMSEQEIRLALLEWRDKWDKELESLKSKKQKLEEEDLYDIDDDNEEVQSFRNNYAKVSEAVSEKHKLLVEKDKELGLYILAPNKTKESICYPKVFSGHLGENVHKFVSDFKTAIEADQIRVKDEIKTLRKYLRKW